MNESDNSKRYGGNDTSRTKAREEEHTVVFTPDETALSSIDSGTFSPAAWDPILPLPHAATTTNTTIRGSSVLLGEDLVNSLQISNDEFLQAVQISSGMAQPGSSLGPPESEEEVSGGSSSSSDDGSSSPKEIISPPAGKSLGERTSKRSLNLPLPPLPPPASAQRLPTLTVQPFSASNRAEPMPMANTSQSMDGDVACSCIERATTQRGFGGAGAGGDVKQDRSKFLQQPILAEGDFSHRRVMANTPSQASPNSPATSNNQEEAHRRLQSDDTTQFETEAEAAIQLAINDLEQKKHNWSIHTTALPASSVVLAPRPAWERPTLPTTSTSVPNSPATSLQSPANGNLAIGNSIGSPLSAKREETSVHTPQVVLNSPAQSLGEQHQSHRHHPHRRVTSEVTQFETEAETAILRAIEDLNVKNKRAGRPSQTVFSDLSKPLENAFLVDADQIETPNSVDDNHLTNERPEAAQNIDDAPPPREGPESHAKNSVMKQSGRRDLREATARLVAVHETSKREKYHGEVESDASNGMKEPMESRPGESKPLNAGLRIMANLEMFQRAALISSLTKRRNRSQTTSPVDTHEETPSDVAEDIETGGQNGVDEGELEQSFTLNLQQKLRRANSTAHEEFAIFSEFLRPKRAKLFSQYWHLFILIVVPLFLFASLFFYVFQNPPTGYANDDQIQHQPSQGSASWWILFSIRQMVSVALAQLSELIFVQYLALSNPRFIRTIGPKFSLVLSQSSGWPW